MVCGGLGVLVYRYDDVSRPHVEKVLDGAWAASWRGDLSLGFHHAYSIIFWWTALKILTVYERRSGTTLSGGGSPRGTDRRRGIRHLEFETGQSHLLGKRSEGRSADPCLDSLPLEAGGTRRVCTTLRRGCTIYCGLMRAPQQRLSPGGT